MNRPQKRQDYGRGTRLRKGDLITADLVNQILAILFGINSAADRLTVEYTAAGITLDLDLAHLVLLSPDDYSIKTRLKITTDTPPNAILQAKKVKLSFVSGKLSIVDTTSTGDAAWVDLLTLSGTALAPSFRIAEISGVQKLQMKKIGFKFPAATTTGPGEIGLDNVPGTADTDYVDVLELGECETPA